MARPDDAVIIDAHAQFGPALANDSPIRPPIAAETADQLVAALDAAGIDMAVVSPPTWLGGTRGQDFIDPNYELANAAIAEGMRAHPGRLVGFARVNPKFGSLARAELDKCFRRYGFRGLYLNNEADSFSYQDLGRLKPLLDLCASERAPVLVHTWVTPSQPVQLILLAMAFPSVNFVMLHSGWRLVADASAAAERAPNLYFETSFTGSTLSRNVDRRFGIERVVFGTNLPYGLPDVELDRIRRWGQLRQEQLDLVLGGNIARLIGLEGRAA